VETHVKVLAFLYIAFSALFVLLALFFVLMFGGVSALVGMEAPPDEAAIAIPFIGLTGMALSAFFMALALPGLFTGFGLLKRANWARILGIVLSALNLVNFPLGTVLGVYGLWVLLNKETERLFETAPSITTT
jgi:hypothetical protein